MARRGKVFPVVCLARVYFSSSTQIDTLIDNEMHVTGGTIFIG